MGDETELGVSKGLGGNDCSRTIGTAIVDHQHLEIQLPAAQNSDDSGDRAGDDLLLVVGS